MTSNDFYTNLDSVFTELLTKYQKRVLIKSKQSYTPNYGKITSDIYLNDFNDIVEKENRYIIRIEKYIKFIIAIDNYGDYLYKLDNSDNINIKYVNITKNKLVKNILPDIFIDFIKNVHLEYTHPNKDNINIPILTSIRPLVDNYYNNYTQMIYIKSKLNEYKKNESSDNSLLFKILKMGDMIEEQEDIIIKLKDMIEEQKDMIEEQKDNIVELEYEIQEQKDIIKEQEDMIGEQKEYIDILQHHIKINEEYNLSNKSYSSYFYNKIKSYFTQ